MHWEIRESITEADVEIILQRAREKFPEQKPRLISDNGPQFIAKEFKEFIRISGMGSYQDFSLLSSKQWKNREMASESKERMYQDKMSPFS